MTEFSTKPVSRTPGYEGPPANEGGGGGGGAGGGGGVGGGGYYVNAVPWWLADTVLVAMILPDGISTQPNGPMWTTLSFKFRPASSPLPIKNGLREFDQLVQPRAHATPLPFFSSTCCAAIQPLRRRAVAAAAPKRLPKPGIRRAYSHLGARE